MATRKMTDEKDDLLDKKAGIREGSKKDTALDKKRGVPEDDLKGTKNLKPSVPKKK